MTPPEHIYEGLGHLVAATPGWTNELANDAVDEYARLLTKAGCLRRECFLEAIDLVATTWQSLARPTPEAIIAAYQAQVAKLPAVEARTDGPVADRLQASAAMRRGYLAECAAQGREPSRVPRIGARE